MKKTKFIFLIVCAFRLYDINAMDTGSDKNLIVEILKKNFENSEKRFYYESQASEVLQTNAAPLILSKEKKIILFKQIYLPKILVLKLFYCQILVQIIIKIKLLLTQTPLNKK